MEQDEFIEQLNKNILEWKRKAKHYDLLFLEDTGVITKLKSLEKELQTIIKDLDPYYSINQKVRVRNNNYKINEIIEEQLKLLNAGNQVTRNFLEKTYPNLAVHQCSYILDQLKKYPSIRTAFDGRKLRLYKE